MKLFNFRNIFKKIFSKIFKIERQIGGIDERVPRMPIFRRNCLYNTILPDFCSRDSLVDGKGRYKGSTSDRGLDVGWNRGIAPINLYEICSTKY